MRAGLFILGGSSIYMPLFWDALQRQRCFFYFDRITLYGRDPGKLAFNTDFGRRMAKTCGARLEIDYTLRLEDSLREEYTIIFNQIRFGGLQARDRDEKCALKNQLVADETLGIVGVSNAIRTITLLRPMLETLTLKKNEFIFVNFTNPCSIVSQYILEHFHFNTVGVCDYPQFVKKEIAAFLDYPPESVRLKYFGLNHFAFIYDVLADGQSVLRTLKVRRNEYKLRFIGDEFFDYLLLPSWEAVFAKEQIIRRQNTPGGRNRATLLLELEREFAAYLEHVPPEQSGTEVPPLLYRRNCEWYDIGLTPFFHGFFGVANHQENILNVDAGDPFDLRMDHCIVETNSWFDANHRPVYAGLPKEVRENSTFHYVKLMKLSEKLLLAGIVKRDTTMIIESCLVNPFIQDLEKVGRYFRELAQVDSLIASFFTDKPSYKVRF